MGTSSLFFIINIILLAILAIFPWIFYNYYRDVMYNNKSTERFSDMFKAFLSGMFVSIFLVVFFKYLFIGNIIVPYLYKNIFGMAAIEEISKAIALGIFLYWGSSSQKTIKKFNEISDGLTYGFLVGLGFAFFENIIYMYKTLENFGFSFDNISYWLNYYGRMITSTLVHGICTSIYGLYFALGYLLLDKLRNISMYINYLNENINILKYRMKRMKEQHLLNNLFEIVSKDINNDIINAIIKQMDNVSQKADELIQQESILMNNIDKIKIKTTKKNAPHYVFVDFFNAAFYHFVEDDKSILQKIFAPFKLLFSIFSLHIFRNTILNHRFFSLNKKITRESWYVEYMLEGVWIAIILHTIYNYSLIKGWFVFIFILMIILLVFIKNKVDELLEK